MRLNRLVTPAILFSIAFCALITAPAVAQKRPQSRYTGTSTRNAGTRVAGAVGMEDDSHFESILTNSQVRIFRLTIAPNEATLLDSHPHDYIVVSFGTNAFEAVGEITRFSLEMSDGEAQILTAGWPHKLVNKAPQPAHLLILEVVRGIYPAQSVCGLGGHSCDQTRFGKTDAGSYDQTMLFETSTVRLLRAELGPGGVLPSHADTNDHLMVMLTDSHLSDGIGAGTEESAGHATWTFGRLQPIKNLGAQDARMLILEIK